MTKMKTLYKIFFIISGTIGIILYLLTILVAIWEKELSLSILLIKLFSILLFIIFILVAFKNKVIYISLWVFLFVYIPLLIFMGKEDILNGNYYHLIISCILYIYCLITVYVELFNEEFAPVVNLFYFFQPKKNIVAIKKAGLYFDKGNIDRANELCTQAMANNAKFEEYAILYGYIQEKLGNYQECKRVFLKCLEMDKKNINIKKIVGKMCYELKEYKESVKYFSEIVQENKADRYVFFYRALDFIEMHSYNNAIKDLSSILKNNPLDSEVYYYRGYCFNVTNKKEKAKDDWNESISLKDPDPRSYISLGTEFYKNGDLNKAKELYKKGLLIDDGLIKYVPEDFREQVQ